MPKSSIHTGPIHLGVTTIIQHTIDDAGHARRRQALSHSFSTQAVLEQEPIVQTYVGKVVANIRRMGREGKEFKIADWFTYFTFDITRDLTFAESFGFLEQGLQ